MVYRLTPQIVALLNIREPVTVYIDSRGGRVDYKDSIYNLLGSSNQSCDPPVKLITVVTSLAASAAADLLSSGSYALAYPDSIIMYHGVRFPGGSDGPITAEESNRRTQRLRADNENYATRLARDTEGRFVFRFISHYHLLADIRQKDPTLTNLRAFLSLVIEHVSGSATKVLVDAFERYTTYSALLESANKLWKKGKVPNKSFVQFEAEQIRALTAFEIKRNKKTKGWNFENEGIHRLTDDFFMLNEYLSFMQGPRFRDICTTWGAFLLSPQQMLEVDALPDAERDEKIVEIVTPALRPVWAYFMALCHVLQQSDYYLSALDAFWLGLIDDVIGEKDLPSLRLFQERGGQLASEQKAAGETAQAPNAAGAEAAGT